jgi:serine/threonine-protein kinase
MGRELATLDVKVGQILAGKYRVERVIGQGAMGVVVAATHLQLAQRVALKFLTAEALQHPEAVARFAREARAAAAIRSEHVVRVLDISALDSGLPYIVMEYLEGCDLAKYREDRGALPIVEAADLTLQACEALAEAHSLGIIHRDLKPANLFLARYADRTSLKILDFGISKILRSDSGAPEFDMTLMGAVMGSPCYMSPEQMRSSRNVDVRTDIWAIGVILYELVAGHLPFQAATMPQLCGVILSQPPPPLRRWRSDVPSRFEALVLCCLDKDPRQRFSGVAELAVALGDFAPPSSSHSVERILKLAGGTNGGIDHRAPPAGPRPEHVSQIGWGHTAQRSRSRSIFGVVFAVALVGGSVLWLVLYRAVTSRAFEPAPLAQPAEPMPTPTAAPTVSAPLPATATTELERPIPPAASVSAAPAPPSRPPPTALDGRM